MILQSPWVAIQLRNTATENATEHSTTKFTRQVDMYIKTSFHSSCCHCMQVSFSKRVFSVAFFYNWIATLYCNFALSVKQGGMRDVSLWTRERRDWVVLSVVRNLLLQWQVKLPLQVADTNKAATAFLKRFCPFSNLQVGCTSKYGPL